MITLLKNHRSSGQNNKAGSSIVEALVALVLFATFIGGACKVVMAHRQVSDQARAHYTAVNIAKNQIEQVRHLRRASYAQIYDLSEDNLRVNAQGEPDADNGKFQRSTTITRVSDSLLEIEVRVDIIDHINLQFDGEGETLKSYMAKLR